eukprot:TRINITY_DN2352_c0_g1_i20.p1 TRINITY_DN2352_c0_g1~~TRINITY_DN2352_c0_g1_i20.p1  ORF type:complete len:606 (+),score=123.99 TRINITY_DN2352_c0_g1_i20:1182-2999(+)
MIRSSAKPSTPQHVIVDIPPSVKTKRTANMRFDGERVILSILFIVLFVWLGGYALFFASHEEPRIPLKPPTETEHATTHEVHPVRDHEVHVETPTEIPKDKEIQVSQEKSSIQREPQLSKPDPPPEKHNSTPDQVSQDKSSIQREPQLSQPNPSPPAEKNNSTQDTVEAKEMQEAVKKAFLHTWNGYVTYAWGSDEIRPVSKVGSSGWGGLGMTIIDSIDTMMIMGLTEEVKRARAWVEGLNFNIAYGASTFESTIRLVGGLLAAYDLSSDDLYLNKARELADRLMPAFKSPSGIPYSTVELNSGRAWSPTWTSGNSFLSEVGSIQLEFRYLSAKTKDSKYADVVNKVMDVISRENVDHFDGLYPTFFHPDTGRSSGSHLTYGSRGDSFYEILLKQYLQKGKKEEKLGKMYSRVVTGTKKRLLKHSLDGLYYIDEMENGRLKNKVDHLTCFAPGMFALDGENLDLAEKLIQTCWQFYEKNPTGLAPEIASMAEDRSGFRNQAPHNLLRPEMVESLFVLYRKTGKQIYRDWGWAIFQAFEKHCKTEAGFSGLTNVGVVPAEHNDKTESFFLAETLKYLYLLFSPPTLIPLDEYVFNTEAHPTRLLI